MLNIFTGKILEHINILLRNCYLQGCKDSKTGKIMNDEEFGIYVFKKYGDFFKEMNNNINIQLGMEENSNIVI